MMYLKQSTAKTLRFGPFVDNGDGFTPESGLTIAQADVRLSKDGGAFAQKNDATSATHDENGWYSIPLNTTDTGTVGTLRIAVYVTGALPMSAEFMVLPAVAYDSLVGGTDTLEVDITLWRGTQPNTLQSGRVDSYAGAMASNVLTAAAIDTDAITAAKIANDAITAAKIATGAIDADAIADNAIDAGAIAAGVFTADKFGNDVTIKAIRTGTAAGGAAQTITLDSGASAVDNFYCGSHIQIVSGTGAGQGRSVAGYVGSTKVVTLSNAWVTNPSTDSVFVISTIPCPVGVVSRGVATAGAATTITLKTGETWGTNFLTGSNIRIVAGTGIGQIRSVASNTNATPSVVTVDRSWATNPDTTSLYEIMAVSDSQITSSDIASSAIGATQIASNAIAATKIASGAITSAKFAAGAIDAAAIATDAIGSAEFSQGAADKVWATAARELTDKTGFGLANGSIVAATFGAGAIDAAAIADDAIDAGAIATGAITNAKFAAGAIDAAAIATGAIGADEFTQAAADKVWSTAARSLTDKAGFGLADDAITAAKFDETTAFPVKSADAGSTAIARTGADADTLETISDQIDGTATAAALTTVDGIVDDILVDTADMQPKLGAPAGASMSADIAAVKSDTGTSLTRIGTPVAIDGSAATIGGMLIKIADDNGGADFDATTDSLNKIAAGGSAGDWTATEKENIRHALGVDGTKTAPTGGYGRVGQPAGASLAADIAAVKSDTADILVDTADMQPKLGTPVTSVSADVAAIQMKLGTPAGASVSADIAGVQSDTDDIQSKIGTPAGASVSADIAAVKSQTAAIETDTQDIQTQIGTAGVGLTNLGGMSTTMRSQVNAEADTALADYDPPTYTELAARTLPSADYFDPTADTVALVTKVNELGTTAKADVNAEVDQALIDYDSSNGVAKQSTVAGIQNNTKVVVSIPQPAIIPATGDNVYRVDVLHYDSAGNMEDPDSSDVGLDLETADGTDKSDILYKEYACTNLLGNSGISGYKKLERTGVGRYFCFMKIANTESAAQLVHMFALDENAVRLYFTRTDNILTENPGTATLADNATNKDIIAEALKERDVSGITAVSGSVYKDIVDDVGDVQSDVTSILADTADMQPKLGTPVVSVSADIAGVQSDTDDIQSKIGTPTGASVSADVAAIKSDTGSILVDTADIQPKIGTPAVSVSADIAAVKSDTAAVLIDTADMQPKLGTPVISVSADIAGIQSDTDDIQSKIGTPAGASVSADVAAIKSDTGAILVDTADMQPKLGTPVVSVSADIAAIQSDVDGITSDVGDVQSDVTDILADTADMQPKLGTPVVSVSDDIAAVKSDTAAVLIDTADIQPKIGTPSVSVAADIAAVKSDTGSILVDTADIQPKIGTPVTTVSGDIAAVQSDVDGITSDVADVQADVTDILVDTADIQPKLGTPVALDSGSATIAGMLTKMADDNGGADFDATQDSLHEIGAAAGGTDWSAAERSQIRDALGVTGTKTSATGGQLQTIDTNVDSVLDDTADMQPKLGTPVSTIAGDIAGVQSDTDDIQSKIGTPAASVAADIAAMQSDVDGIASDTAAILIDTADIQPKIGTPSATVSGDIAAIQTKLGSPAGASVSADIAAIDGDVVSMQSDVDDILADTSDIQPKIGTPVTTVAGDIASVQSDTDDIQSKIGTPVSSVSADIASVKSTADDILVDTADIQPKLGTLVSLDGGAATVGGMLTKMADDNGGATFDAAQDSLHEIGGAAGGTDWSAAERENIRQALGIDGTKSAPTGGYGRLGQPAGTSVTDDIASVKAETASILADTADMQPKIGTPIALDSGTATISGMLIKMADDNGGADFDAATDSLNKIADGSGGGTDWTVAERENIRHALGVDGTKTAPTGGYGRVGQPVGVSLAVDIAAVKAETSSILADTADMQPKLGIPVSSVSADIASVKSDTGSILVDTADIQPKIGTPVTTISGDIAGVQSDTNDIQSKVGTPVSTLAVDIASVKSETASIKSDTNSINTKIGTPVSLDGGAATVGGMLTKMADDNGGVSFDATNDSLHELGASVGGTDWTPTERANIRQALGVDGTKTAPTGGYGRIGQPAGASVSADIAAVQSTSNTINTKVGTPAGASVSADIASVQSTANTLNTKVGTPAGASVSADIAAVKVDTADTRTKATTMVGVDGAKLATLQPLYAPSKAGDQMNLSNSAITAAKYDGTSAFPIRSDDSASTRIARTGTDSDTLKTISDQVDGVQTTVSGIQNNTDLVASVPSNMIVPPSGTTMYQISANFYDDAGNPEDPDSNELALKVSTVNGALKTALYDDNGGSISSTPSVTFTNFYKMVRLGAGRYQIFYKMPSSETANQWQFEFALNELSVEKHYPRTSMVTLDAVGAVTLADNATNKLIVAESVLSVPANKLATDISGRVDVSLIEGVDATSQIASNAAAGVLSTPANKLVTDTLGQAKADVKQWNGTYVSVGTTSGKPVVDAQAISDSNSAADSVESNISNLNATVSSRAEAGSQMGLLNGAITDAKFDQSTAYPVRQADTGATSIARTGADGDTLKSLSDQVDTTNTRIGGPVSLDGGLATLAGMLTKLADDANGSAYDATTDSQRSMASVGSAGPAQTAIAVWNELVAGHNIIGSYGRVLKDAATDTTTIKSDVSAIKVLVTAIDAVTSIIPDGGAMTSIAHESTLATIISDIADTLAAVEAVQTTLDNPTDGLTALKTAINAIPADTMASIVDGTKTLQQSIREILAYCAGKLVRNPLSNVYTYYDSNGTTPVFTFNATSTERTRV